MKTWLRTEWKYVLYSWRLALRSRRYVPFLLITWFSFLFVPKRWITLHLGFLCLQRLDDILDGDLPHADPDGLALLVCRGLRGDPTPSPEFVEWRLLIDSLPENRREDFSRNLISLIEYLRRDYHRRQQHERWSWDEIMKQHLGTFEESFRFLFLALGVEFPKEFMGEFGPVISICSLDRDLPADLRKGIINLPLAIAPEDLTVQRLWRRDLQSQAKSRLSQVRSEFSRLGRSQKLILWPFLFGVRRYFAGSYQFQ